MAAITFHQAALYPVITSLKNAHAFVTKGYEHAKAQNIDQSDLLTARLHPDMYDFTYQVHSFTDSAKAIPNRVNPAVENMDIPKEEKTFPELLARIDKSIKYLEGIDPSSFEGREGAEVPVKFRDGTLQMTFTAVQYVLQMAHPNYWFHITTAYDILRHKGVDVGKFDFLNGAGLVKITPVEKTE